MHNFAALGMFALFTFRKVGLSCQQRAGRVYSAEGIGIVAKRHGVPFLLDACQSVGQMPLDVAKLGCDWLSGTSRKYLRGPRGVGFLYASECAPAGLVYTAVRPVSGRGAVHFLNRLPQESLHPGPPG